MILHYIGACCITYPLRGVLPLSLLYIGLVLSQLLPRGGPIRNTWVLLFSFSEAAFFLYFLWKRKKAQTRHPGPKVSIERRREVFERVRSCVLGDETPCSFLDQWFGRPLNDVSRGDLRKWMAWALFDRSPYEVSDDLQPELDEMVKGIEESAGVVLKEDKPPSKLMRLNIDTVYAQHRPLVYYLACSAMDMFSDAFLYYKGFRRECIGPVSFWVQGGTRDGRMKKKIGAQAQPQPQPQPQKTPLVFVHGVGMGLVTYLPLLRRLAALSSSSAPVMLLELPHVSMKLGVEVPSIETIVACTEVAMARHGFGADGAVWLGHSLGTFIVAAVQRQQPKLIRSVVLVDPVCFLLHEASVIWNFCYRAPSTPMQIIQHYHISREIHIAHYFHRHFWWHECAMFAEDMAQLKNAIVFVSANDDITNTKRVIQYLKDQGPNVKTKVFDNSGHGGWILDYGETSQILSAVTERLNLADQ
ncbi:unnamed protein product [Chrysoparadoxa australica]